MYAIHSRIRSCGTIPRSDRGCAHEVNLIPRPRVLTSALAGVVVAVMWLTLGGTAIAADSAVLGPMEPYYADPLAHPSAETGMPVTPGPDDVVLPPSRLVSPVRYGPGIPDSRYPQADPRGTPGPRLGFDAVIDTPVTRVPPDTHIAAGTGTGNAGRVIMVTNGRVQIWDKTGATVAGPTLLTTMFAANVFDPKILFDQHSGRFFIVALEVGFAGQQCNSAITLSRIHIAVSSSGTPSNLTTNWTFLAGNSLINIGGIPTWADYPGIGADNDSLFITTNQFDGLGCGFRGANIRVFDKAQLMAGVYAFVDLTFNVGVSPFTIQPAHVYGTTDNGGFYLINRINANTYRWYNITGDPAAPVATTGTAGWASGNFPGDTTADQCTIGNVDLDTLSSRAMNAVYRNGMIYVCLTSDPDGDGQTEAVWQVVATNGGPPAAPTIADSGFINGTGANNWTYMPSINVDSAGNVAMCFTESSATRCADVSYALRFAADPPGTFRPPVVARIGPGFYDSFFFDPFDPPRDRWGDYSATVVDPVDECFWIANEFAWTSVVGASEWATHIANFCPSNDGACCFGSRACAELSQADCQANGGSFRGVGTKCPTQNVQTAMHGAVQVVHWSDPALDCNQIVRRGGTEAPGIGQVSNCCTEHGTPGCQDQAVADCVCAIDPSCCEELWHPACADLAQLDCGADCTPSEEDCIPGPLIDAWVTAPFGEGTDTCHIFGIPESPPIPEGFFGPGSEPFEGQVCFVGEPLGNTPFGEYSVADTLILRGADPFDPCEVTFGEQRDVPIQIVALNLRSVQPIAVNIAGQPTLWDVAVDLSSFPQPDGFLTATKEHCNGGTYSSFLPVQPRFTFTRVDDPTQFRTLDTGEFGIPPANLDQVQHPWVHELDPNFFPDSPYCTGFHVGADDPVHEFDCDCQGNGVRDDCDITSGVSADCDANGVPDECDPDGDADLVPDTCDNCPAMPNPTQDDSDGDLLGDVCDPCPNLAAAIEGDQDGDRVLDADDNCPCVPNRTQEDADSNGVGDACEAEPMEACCLPDGGCVDVLAGDCPGIGQGAGTSCAAHASLCEADCNTNGRPDLFEIQNGQAADVNGNGVPDECEADCCDPASNRNGDWDGDCDVDLRDWSAMQICLGRSLAPRGTGGCLEDGCMLMDMDADGTLTTADHDMFAQALDVSGPGEALLNCNPAAGTCDAWATGPPDDPGLEFGGTYYVFGDPAVAPTGYGGENPPIPADFFGPGSLPFEGVVELTGQPEDLPTMGTTDTLIEHPPLRFGFGPLPACDTVPARLSELHLRSRDPIVVMMSTNGADCNGNGVPDIQDIAGGTSFDQNTNGTPDECEYYVAAELSVLPAPDGDITACKTHSNGGLFDATVFVQPLFVFVNKAALDASMAPDSSNVRTLDTGEENMTPITFQFTDVPFSICAPPGLGVYTTPCSQGNFVPGVDTTPEPCEKCPDLDGNGQVDIADFAAWQSQIGCTPGQSNPECEAADLNCDGAVNNADGQIVTNCLGLSIDECPACAGGARGGLRQATTCQSHLSPGESHYFCPPRCIDSVCTYPRVGPTFGFCLPFGCGFPMCPGFPGSLSPGFRCTALNPNSCPRIGFFLLRLGRCPSPPCLPLGICVQFYGPPATCTPTGRFLCP